MNETGVATARRAFWGGVSAESISDWVKEFTPTFACWDLLECVHSRRSDAATAESLGGLVGRSLREIEPALAHLVSRGVLRRRLTPSGDALYAYDPPPEIAERVDEMLVKLPQHAVRLQVVTTILSVNAAVNRSETSGTPSESARRRGS